ncbi:Uncharacterised protein [uncultured archaeon]|nr:Uncharacterised protein [uncultured archaeon]
MSKQSLEALIKQGRINIFAVENTKEYVKALLSKFENNFGMEFEGNIDVRVLYSKSGPYSFALDIAPSDNSSYILSVNSLENCEKSQIFCSIDCVQIKISDLIYQIRYSHLN